MPDIYDRINILAKELHKLEPLKPEYRERLDKKFRLEFNYNSNHLEGNTLTYGETELLLLFDDTKGNHSMREYEEMKAHDLAYKLVQDRAGDSERPLNEQFIKELNKIILVRPYWKEAQTYDGQTTRREIIVGDYKQQPNSVRLANGEMFHYTAPADTPIEMQELLDWYRSQEKIMHPAELAAMLHYKFVRIHPFDDGNGRVARLLVNYVFLKNNLSPIIIKSADKPNYLRTLHQADGGDFEPLILYIGEQLLWSLNISLRAANGETVEEKADVQKEVAILSGEVQAKGLRSKSPQNVVDIFNEFKKNGWRKINDSIKDFAALYEESKEYHYVNDREEVHEVRGLVHDISVRISTPSRITIFGFDIYETEVKTIEWQIVLYGIKGANKDLNIKLRTTLSFKANTYSIHFLINGKVIYSENFAYSFLISQNQVSTICETVAANLLAEIKTKMGKDL